MFLTRPRWLLHVEGAVVFAVAVLLYWRMDGNWLVFIVLVLAPDLGMLGYVADTRLGAATYNLLHTSTPPLLLAVVGVLTGNNLLITVALIWLAHIAADRAMGFGLKYPTQFKDTHFQRL